MITHMLPESHQKTETKTNCTYCYVVSHQQYLVSAESWISESWSSGIMISFPFVAYSILSYCFSYATEHSATPGLETSRK